jgi:hypothetical protein
MQGNGRPLVPYMRQSRAKERTISIEEQRRDILYATERVDETALLKPSGWSRSASPRRATA